MCLQPFFQCRALTLQKKVLLMLDDGDPDSSGLPVLRLWALRNHRPRVCGLALEGSLGSFES